MKKRRRKKNTISLKWAPVLLLGLLVPAGLNFLWNLSGSLGVTGERAAVLASAFNMPEGGLDLLEERFRAQLYDPSQDGSGASSAPEQQASPDDDSHAPQAESSQPESSTTENGRPVTPPKIPAEFQAALISENFNVTESTALVKFGAGNIKNETRLTDEEVEWILETSLDLGFTDTQEPQVLIVHTHATESFEMYDTDVYDTRNTWRSRDNNNNMVAVGAAMAAVLEENGIGVIHDTTQHDYPSYNGSYERSAETIKAYLEEYPTIKVVLDLHRDAMERENQTIVKPVAVIDGKKAAQIMIISACDDGSMGIPNYASNLRFAAAFQDYMEEGYSNLTRPVYFCYRKYNMDLTPGSLLLEFGSNANTLEEAVYSATLAGQALSDLIWDQILVD